MFACPRAVSRLFATALVAAVVLAGTAGHALAQTAGKEAPKDNKALAKEHFQRGTSFYDLGRYSEAIREFEAAYQLKNDPAFLYNLAQAYRLVGNPERALHFYRTYLRYVPKAANRAEIEERIEALEKAAAEKGAAQTSPPPVGTTPPPISPPPTTTAPPATTPPTTTPPPATTTPPASPPPSGATAGPPPPAPGAVPSTGADASAAPPPFAPTTTATQPAETADRSVLARRLVFGGRIAVGVGAGMWLIGIIQGLRASAASKDVEDAAENNDFFDPSVEERGQSAERAQWAWIGLGTLVGAAGGAAWYYGLRLQAKAERAASTTGQPGASLSFTPMAGPGRAGGLLQVRF